MKKKVISSFFVFLILVGTFAPFAMASDDEDDVDYSNPTNTWQASNPTLDSYYSNSLEDYWPILTNLEDDECEGTESSDFIVAIPVGGCSPTVVRSDLLAEQNVPVFCQLSAIKVNPFVDISAISSISFKGDYPEGVAGISFHPARAAIASTETLLGDAIEQNIGYVVIILEQTENESAMEEYISGMLTATVTYDESSSFGTKAGAYYLDAMSDSEWSERSAYYSFWDGKGYLRATEVEDGSATIEVMTDKENVWRTVTLEEGETSDKIYWPGQYCTTSLQLKLNDIDNGAEMVWLNIDGDAIWARVGTELLDGKCYVKSINSDGDGSGDVSIKCTGTSSPFTLSLTAIGADTVTGSRSSFDYAGYSFWAVSSNRLESDKVVDGEEETWYYFKDGDSWYWVNPNEEDASGMVTAKTENDNEGSYEEFLGKANSAVASYVLNGEDFETKYNDSRVYKYYDLAEEATLDLIDNYPYETDDNDEYFGEEVLLEQIKLAIEIGDKESQMELIDLFLSKYPNSNSATYLEDTLIELQNYDTSAASKIIVINNDNHVIRAVGFSGGAGSGDFVNVRLDGGSLVSLNRNVAYDKYGQELEDITERPRLTVTSISSSSASFRYYWIDEDGDKRDKALTLGVGERGDVGGLNVLVTDTSVDEVAYVSLIPTIDDSTTAANFTFNIGIEQRAIELTPEKANEKIENLNESINEWNQKIEQLGNLIRGMKAACLGVSTVLNLKAMFAGFEGDSIARGDIMDFYESKCRSEGYSSEVELQTCYSKYSDEIEDSIDDYKEVIENVNERASCAENDETVKTNILTSEVTDSALYLSELKSCAGLDSDWTYEVRNVTVGMSSLKVEDIKVALFYDEACSSGNADLCEMATEQLNEALSDNVDKLAALQQAKQSSLVDNLPAATNPYGDAIEQSVVSAKSAGLEKYATDASNYVTRVYDPLTMTVYIAEVDKNYQLIALYTLKGVAVNDNGEEDGLYNRVAQKYRFTSEEIKAGGCTNTMNSPFVRYYEESNEQGFVAIVPFDIGDGWYAYVPSDGYDESGQANFFYVCNVGKDGAIDNEEDACSSFSVNIGSTTYMTACPSLSDSNIKALYQKALAAIEEANSDGNGITVDGTRVVKAAPMGADESELECTDFMSVDDCNLMFNVCDPVICPTSRCDMGGKYAVADVVSTGILGSIALCLPNFGSPSDGGVLIPVCLSGIYAGLQSYVSILEAHRDCLEENIESGTYTGICDEISSIYLCEFFWGQATPLLDNLLPAMLSSLTGESQVRGGAEYLVIDSALENIEASVDYFTNNYAENMFDSLSLSNTEEIGSTVCKAFVGSSLPTSASLLDSLLDPESPTQFYGYFSSTLFTDATVPSTSQYNVYYHIYAGEDSGVQYKVYMKDPPETSYYANRQTVLVDSGYISAGDYADESKDFTAPTGYKQLCVSLNGVDECGFGQVGSDFALNYATEAYVADQADDTGITTTADCVTTSSSAWGLASLNLQSGIETSLGGDDIATAGIVRVCASTNPEEGIVSGNDVTCDVDSGSGCSSGYDCVAISGTIELDYGYCEDDDGNREQSVGTWVDVGYCDDVDMRCWLNTESVSDSLELYSALTGTIYAEDLAASAVTLSGLEEEYEEIIAIINDIEERISTISNEDKAVESDGEPSEEVSEILELCDDVQDAYGLNAHKAHGYLLKSELYRIITEELLSNQVDIKTSGTVLSDEEKEIVENVEEESSGEEEVSEVSSEEDSTIPSLDTSGVSVEVDGNCDVTKTWSEVEEGDVLEIDGKEKVVSKVEDATGGLTYFELDDGISGAEASDEKLSEGGYCFVEQIEEEEVLVDDGTGFSIIGVEGNRMIAYGGVSTKVSVGNLPLVGKIKIKYQNSKVGTISRDGLTIEISEDNLVVFGGNDSDNSNDVLLGELENYWYDLETEELYSASDMGDAISWGSLNEGDKLSKGEIVYEIYDIDKSENVVTLVGNEDSYNVVVLSGEYTFSDLGYTPVDFDDSISSMKLYGILEASSGDQYMIIDGTRDISSGGGFVGSIKLTPYVEIEISDFSGKVSSLGYSFEN